LKECLFFLISTHQVEAESLSGFLKKLEAVSKNTNTLAAKFTQIKHLALFQTAISSEGLLRFRQPSDLRWEIFPPDKSLLLLSKDKVQLSSNHNYIIDREL